MIKYSKLLNTEYITFGEEPKKEYDYILAFVLPVDQFIHYSSYARKFAKKKFYIMSICETSFVHPGYGEMFKVFPNVITPSEFCRDVFKNQFNIECQVVPLYASIPLYTEIPSGPYTFYTIGNMADPRKNIKMLLESFLRCNFGPDAKLLLKASCREPYKLNLPNVEIVNEMLSEEEMDEKIHQKAHCYINCSHSEGVGMGAVEAAIRNKPVIITDYGGLKEYVKTPYTIKCTMAHVGSAAEFLFTSDMMWGQPDKEQLIKYMKHCFENKVTSQDHPETILKVNDAIRFFSHGECSNT
jgi:glycosyltransferase involved in cell wall biosynthesis